MSQQPKRRRPKPRPRTQQAAVTVPPVTTQPIPEGTIAPTAAAPVTPAAVEPVPAPSISAAGDPHGYLAIGLAAGAFAVVAFLTILAAMAAT